MSRVRVTVKEGDIVRACRAVFREEGWVHWRNQTGRFFGAGGGSYPTGTPGLADLCGIIPPRGRILMVECKTATGKVSEVQERFLATATGLGAFCVVIRDAEDLRWVLGRLEEDPDLGPGDL